MDLEDSLTPLNDLKKQESLGSPMMARLVNSLLEELYAAVLNTVSPFSSPP